jgi:hypothetical protein
MRVHWECGTGEEGKRELLRLRRSESFEGGTLGSEDDGPEDTADTAQYKRRGCTDMTGQPPGD